MKDSIGKCHHGRTHVKAEVDVHFHYILSMGPLGYLGTKFYYLVSTYKISDTKR